MSKTTTPKDDTVHVTMTREQCVGIDNTLPETIAALELFKSVGWTVANENPEPGIYGPVTSIAVLAEVQASKLAELFDLIPIMPKQ